MMMVFILWCCLIKGIVFYVIAQSNHVNSDVIIVVVNVTYSCTSHSVLDNVFIKTHFTLFTHFHVRLLEGCACSAHFTFCLFGMVSDINK